MLYDDGYDTISTIIHWKYDSIRKWCTTKSKLTTTGGGATHGDSKIKFIQKLQWWATYLTLQGKQIDLYDFDATIMVDFKYEEKLDYEDGKKDPDIKKPDKLSHSKWVAREDMVYT